MQHEEDIDEKKAAQSEHNVDRGPSNVNVAS